MNTPDLKSHYKRMVDAQIAQTQAVLAELHTTYAKFLCAAAVAVSEAAVIVSFFLGYWS